jgi:hypothetical protein
MAELVVIASFRTRLDADLAKAALESRSIPAMVMADDAGGFQPHLLWGSGGVYLNVRAEDEERARQVLEGVEAPRSGRQKRRRVRGVQ